MRNRNYRRIVRRKAIKRKFNIRKFKLGYEEAHEYYKNNPIGELDKGKIHCSCYLCRRKSNDELSKRDKINLLK